MPGFSSSTLPGLKGAKHVNIPANTNNAEDNVFSGTASINMITIDARRNPQHPVYFKGDDVTSVTPGTTLPKIQIKVPGGKVQHVAIIEPAGDGYDLSNGLSCWCDKNAADNSNTAPDGVVETTIVAT